MGQRPKSQQPTEQVASQANGWNLVSLCAVAVAVFLAAAVRIWASQDELWLDEIWTLLALGRNIHSPLDILTAHHDNNHYLITLWMYITSPQQNWVVYRVPSIVAGVVTVALAAQVALRWGRPAALAAALLTGASFVLIFYASEARGYALAGCFALAAFLTLERFLARREIRTAIAFAVFTILGTLSHLTFVQFYAGAFVWSAVALVRKERASTAGPASWPEFLNSLMGLHAAPTFFLLLLYAVDVRALEFGGGDPYDMRHVLGQACTLAIGTCGAGQPLLAISIAAVILLTVTALFLLARERADIWIFFLVGFVITPTLLLGLRPPPVLHARYFYLNILFFLILVSYLLGRAATWNRAGRYATVATALLFLVANAYSTYDFLRIGRGHFLEALQYMADNSTQADVNISGDAEFTYRLYTEFYAPYVLTDRQFLIHTIVPEMPVEPEWVVLNSQEQPYTPKPSILDNHGREAFLLERVFPYAGLSGAHFAVYHRTTMRGTSTRDAQ